MTKFIRLLAVFAFLTSWGIVSNVNGDMVNKWFGTQDFVSQYYKITKGLNKKQKKTQQKTSQKEEQAPESNQTSRTRSQKTTPHKKQNLNNDFASLLNSQSFAVPSVISTKQSSGRLPKPIPEAQSPRSAQPSNIPAPISPLSKGEERVPSFEQSEETPPQETNVPENAREIPRQSQQLTPPPPVQSAPKAPPVVPLQTNRQPEETQPEETQPEETQPAETKPEETKSKKTKPVKTRKSDGLEFQLQGSDAGVIDETGFREQKQSNNSYKNAEQQLQRSQNRRTKKENRFGYVTHTGYFVQVAPQYLSFSTNANSIFNLVFPETKGYGVNVSYGYQTRWWQYVFIRYLGSVAVQSSAGSSTNKLTLANDSGVSETTNVTAKISTPLSISGLMTVGLPIGANTVPYVAFGPQIVLYNLNVAINKDVTKANSPFPGASLQLGMIRAFSNKLALYFAFETSMFIHYSKTISFSGGETKLTLSPFATTMKIGLIWNFA